MLGQLERHKFPLLALAAALVVSALAIGAMAGGPSDPITFQAASSLPDGTPIRVHVAGEVARPGVIEMFEGERVIDAINEAGGATSNADVDALNLARRLRDGERIEVPSRSAPRGAASPAPAPLTAGQPLNINTATLTQLDQLPGIGEAYSRRIVDSRSVDGPFKTIEELLSRRVVPASTFNGIRDLITVGP